MRADGRKIGLGKAVEVIGLFEQLPVNRLPTESFLDEFKLKLFGYVVTHDKLISIEV